MVDPLSYFSFQQVLHDWYYKEHCVWDGVYKRTSPDGAVAMSSAYGLVGIEF